MLSKKILLTVNLFFILVIGCNNNNPSQTLNPIKITETPKFTQTPVSISTSTQPTNIINNCVTEYDERPKEYNTLSGVVLIRSLSAETQGLAPSLLSLRYGTTIDIDLSNQSMWEAKISPDNTTLAYKWFNDETSQWELVLIDATNSNRKVIWISKDDFSIFGWINNSQIFLFTGEYTIVDIYQNTEGQVIPFDFPEFDAFDNIHHFYVVFDPLISKVIYKSTDINILDLDTKTIIAKIPDSYDRGIIAAWSPSGRRAAIVSSNPEDINNIASDEIFLVNDAGQITQLTHLLESFGSGQTIDSLSWSPDEKKIAFWRHNSEGNLTLIVVDVLTGEAKNYCIKNLASNSFPVDIPAPIWSPDENILLVESRYDIDKSRLLVVDISENIAFPIAENSIPIGWMIEE